MSSNSFLYEKNSSLLKPTHYGQSKIKNYFRIHYSVPKISKVVRRQLQIIIK